MSLIATVDVINSTLASSLRFWRGANARPASRQPARHLELYEFEACPYCRLVREALTELDAMILPAPHGGTRFRPQVAKLGGRTQFPFLVDPNTKRSMYESADIIEHLYEQYGGRHAPTRVLRPLDVASSSLASARDSEPSQVRDDPVPRKAARALQSISKTNAIST
jgi:glutathione S-transferase